MAKKVITGVCMACGQRKPTAWLSFHKHTGMLLMWSNTSYKAELCGTCGGALGRQCRNHCLAAGWWSFSSIFLNPVFLSMNAYNNSKARKLATAPTVVATRPVASVSFKPTASTPPPAAASPATVPVTQFMKR